MARPRKSAAPASASQPVQDEAPKKKRGGQPGNKNAKLRAEQKAATEANEPLPQPEAPQPKRARKASKLSATPSEKQKKAKQPQAALQQDEPKRIDCKLTKRQEAFVFAYLETGNAAEAYRQSYSTSNMKTETIIRNAHELLKHTNISAIVNERRAQARQVAETRYLITADRVISELAKIAFANAEDYFEWGQTGVVLKESSTLTPDQRSVVAEVSQTVSQGGGGTIRVKLSDKQSALEKLGRTLGIFKDKMEHTGPGGGPVQSVLMTRAEFEATARQVANEI